MQHLTKMLLQTKQLTMLRQKSALPLLALPRKPVCSNQLRKSCFAILYLLLFVFVNCAGDAVAYEFNIQKQATKQTTKTRAIGVGGSATELDSPEIHPQESAYVLKKHFKQKPTPTTTTTSEKQQHQYQVQQQTRETIREPLKPIGEKRK